MVNACVVGLQWGDEGKAKILDDIVQEAKNESDKRVWVVRYQGGANAGHTICAKDLDGNLTKFVTHAAPSGLTSNSDIAIGPNVAFDPEKFLNEVNEARKVFGYNAEIHISERVGISFDYHKKLDAWHESNGECRIGTTQSGIGPFYADNAMRTSRITFADYTGDNFHDKLRQVLKAKSLELRTANIITERYVDDLIAIHDPIRKELKPYNCRLEYRLNDALRNKESIILEGAQGTMLDVDLGTIPDVTSSHLLATEGLASLGLPRSAFKIFGVEKIYPTRVGEGSMPTLALDDFGVEVQKNAGEAGATTGRKRRVGYPDWVVLKYTSMLNDVDGIFITRADCVQGYSLKVCVSYIDNYRRKGNHSLIKEVPLKLENVLPVYIGKSYKYNLWEGDKDLSDPIKVDKALADKRRAYVEGGFKELPIGLTTFIKDQNEYVGKPVSGVSIGPSRGETVMMKSRL